MDTTTVRLVPPTLPKDEVEITMSYRDAAVLHSICRWIGGLQKGPRSAVTRISVALNKAEIPYAPVVSGELSLVDEWPETMQS